MTAKVITAALLLLTLTTLLCVAVFNWHYRDYFYVREVYRAPEPEDRPRLIEIAAKGYHHEQSYTAMSMMLCRAFMELGDTELAVEIAEEQVRLNPDDLGILRTWADALAMDGRNEEAAEIYETLLQHARAMERVSAKEE